MSITINNPTSENLNNGIENGISPICAPVSHCNPLPCPTPCAFNPASVLTFVPVSGQQISVPTAPNTTVVVVLENAAPLATLTCLVAPLATGQVGNVVVTTYAGLVACSIVGAVGLIGNELNAVYSSISLTWNGSAWVRAV